jgi:hypothetical protein
VYIFADDLPPPLVALHVLALWAEAVPEPFHVFLVWQSTRGVSEPAAAREGKWQRALERAENLRQLDVGKEGDGDDLGHVRTCPRKQAESFENSQAASTAAWRTGLAVLIVFFPSVPIVF